MKWKVSRWASLVVSSLALVLPLLAVSPAQAAAPQYVALGDSYASGTGIDDYIDDGTSCKRSPYAYAPLIAAARGYNLNFRACSGARIPDVQNNQLGALSSSTKYVSISIGGNDAGFADVLTECAMPGWMSNCNAAIDDAQYFIRYTLPGRLSTLYGQIRSKAPNAKVVVVGYPRIFMGEDCNAGTWFSPSEQSRLNYTADLINSRTRSQAWNKGFSFANPTSRFIGHAVCDDPEWINGLSWPIDESFHPNRSGHRYGYTPTVSPLLTGNSLTVSKAVVKEAAASADELAETQEQYAAADATIDPVEFRKPDLTSKRAQRAAARAGVDLDSLRSINRADRKYSRAQAESFAR